MTTNIWMLDWSIICLVVAFCVACVGLDRRINTLNRTLDRVRMATYELTKADREDIEDLQDALKAAGIDLPRPRMNERMRRMTLSPEAREAESIARFNQVVAEVEGLTNQKDGDA